MTAANDRQIADHCVLIDENFIIIPIYFNFDACRKRTVFYDNTILISTHNTGSLYFTPNLDNIINALKFYCISHDIPFPCKSYILERSLANTRAPSTTKVAPVQPRHHYDQ